MSQSCWSSRHRVRGNVPSGRPCDRHFRDAPSLAAPDDTKNRGTDDGIGRAASVVRPIRKQLEVKYAVGRCAQLSDPALHLSERRGRAFAHLRRHRRQYGKP